MARFTGASFRDKPPADQAGSELRQEERREAWKVILYGILVVAITFILLGLLRFWMVNYYGGI